MFKQKNSPRGVSAGVQTLILNSRDLEEREFGGALIGVGDISQAEEEFLGTAATKAVSNDVPLHSEDGSVTDLKAFVTRTTQKKAEKTLITHTIVVTDISNNHVSFPITIIDASKSVKIYANVTDASNSVTVGQTIVCEYYPPGKCTTGRLCVTEPLSGTLALTADWESLLRPAADIPLPTNIERESYYVSFDDLVANESALDLTGAGRLAQIAVEKKGASVQKVMSFSAAIYDKSGLKSDLTLAVKSTQIKNAGVTVIRNNFSIKDPAGRLMMAFTNFVSDTSKPSTSYAAAYCVDAELECNLNKTVTIKYLTQGVGRGGGYVFYWSNPENCKPNTINLPGLSSLYTSGSQTEELSSAVTLVKTGGEAQVKAGSAKKAASAGIPAYVDGGLASEIKVTLSSSSLKNSLNKIVTQQRCVLSRGNGDYVSYSNGFNVDDPDTALISTVNDSNDPRNLGKSFKTEY